MSREELLSIYVQSLEANDMEVNEKVISENTVLINQVFMLSGIVDHNDKIHVSQYDQNIDIARQMLQVKEAGMLN